MEVENAGKAHFEDFKSWGMLRKTGTCTKPTETPLTPNRN
jgi:hypothetical protein